MKIVSVSGVTTVNTIISYEIITKIGGARLFKHYLLTPEYHLFVNLRSGFKDIILGQFYPPLRRRVGKGARKNDFEYLCHIIQFKQIEHVRDSKP